MTFDQLSPYERDRAVLVTTHDMIEQLATGGIRLMSPNQDHIDRALREGVIPSSRVRSSIVREILRLSLAVAEDTWYSDEYRLRYLMPRSSS